VVIQALGFTHSCVYAWLALVPDRELGSPENPCLKGRQLKIQAPQMRWLYRTITGKTPCSSGSSLLCGRERSSVCCCEGSSKLKLSLANVGRLLKQLGLTRQHPLFRATEQDPERVRPWRQEEDPAIRQQARQAGAEIYLGTKRVCGRIARGRPGASRGRSRGCAAPVSGVR
jgi:transposase